MSAAASLIGGRAEIGRRVIWDEATLKVEAGEFVAVLGPNGAGKSTLLRVLLGQLPLAAGRASVLGEAPGRMNAEIGYLPQRHGFAQGTRIRGIDLVRLGWDGARWGIPLRRGRVPQVDEAIQMVGAGAYAERPVGELSGGEQQRLLIAQALVRRPRLLILDEPLDSLDLPTQTAVAALLARISVQQGTTVLLVAHDVNPLLPHLDGVIYFGSGRAAAGAPREVINSKTLSTLYGATVEVIETPAGRLIVVGTPEAPSHHGDRHGHGHGHGHG